MSPAPARLEQLLEPAWLTAALSTRFPGIEIATVTLGAVISRVSTNARFHIECAGDLPDGLPADLCAKGYFTDGGWAYREAGETEAYFYRDLARSIGIRTLRSVYAEVDPDTHHGVVVSEDVVAQGATFLDLSGEYTADRTAQSLEELAKLHAATWVAPEWANAPWLASRLEQWTRNRGVDDIRENFDGQTGGGVPAEVRDAQKLFDAYLRLAREVPSTTPWAVIHGDPHPGNIYVDSLGRPSFLDWQLVQRAPWYLDVGYHIASALTVEDRREHEVDLLIHYLDSLRGEGIDAPDFGEAWRSIRWGILHGFYLWGITLKVDPAITRALLHRLGTAAEDHDVLGDASN